MTKMKQPEDPGTLTALTEPSPSPKRVKRQAATIAQDAIQASNQAASASGTIEDLYFEFHEEIFACL